jgi:hypothetical protein
VAVWESDNAVWYSCPVNFAHQYLYDWVEQCNFFDKFGGARYDRLPAKWFEAWGIYEAALRRLKPMQRDDRQGLEALKGALNGR